MNESRIIIGVYINPWVWIVEDNEDWEKLNETDFNIRDIIFHDNITSEVEICIQRQGFVIASFSNDFFNIDLNNQKTFNVLLPEIGLAVIDFFNSFSYLLYDIQFKKGGFYSAKQFIELSDLWRWVDKPEKKLIEISVEQPQNILAQEKNFNFLEEMISPIVYMSVGQIDKKWKNRYPLEIEQIKIIIDLLKRFKNEWNYLSMLNKAINYNLRGDFNTAHIICWSLIEKLVDYEWSQLPNITNKYFPVSRKIKRLKLEGLISEDLFKKSIDASIKRNNWIHSLEQIKSQDYINCYFVAKDFLSRRLKYELKHPGSFFIQQQ